jgi:Na+/H+-dicarboxylate symporter
MNSSAFSSNMKKIKLHWQILIGLVLAIIYGIIFPTSYQIQENSLKELTRAKIESSVIEKMATLSGTNYDTRNEFSTAAIEVLGMESFEQHEEIIYKAAYYNKAIEAVGWMGVIFLRALKMIIIPLILSSLISGVTNIGTGENLGRLGLKTISYYLLTSTFAIITGLFFVNIIKPGIGADLNFSQKVEGLVESQRSLGQTLIEIVPTNIFQSFNNNAMLSIIFFAVIFGFFITRISDPHRKFLKEAFNAVFEVMMQITLFVIKFTPFGVFGIVAKVVADQDDLANLGTRMGLYMGTVILALLIHFLLTLPLLVKLVGKARPYRHLVNMSTPLLTAFSTSSSGATLPLTMKAVEQNSGVSNKISSFTLPLGATINMDGTALYECVAAIFIAQAYGVDLSLIQQMIIIVTALLASIGAAAIPMAGLVMITVILTAVGLPLEGVGLILAVDRILDMFRTATNVWSDSCGAVIIAKSEGERLNV